MREISILFATVSIILGVFLADTRMNLSALKDRVNTNPPIVELPGRIEFDGQNVVKFPSRMWEIPKGIDPLDWETEIDVIHLAVSVVSRNRLTPGELN